MRRDRKRRFGGSILNVEFGEDEIGRLGPESSSPGLVGDRWAYNSLAELSEAELELRGWDDWWFWEDIKGDRDEWKSADPVDTTEEPLREEGLTVYASFDEWREIQQRDDDATQVRNLR